MDKYEIIEQIGEGLVNFALLTISALMVLFSKRETNTMEYTTQ